MKKNLLLVVFSFLSISLGFSQTERAWNAFNGGDVKVAASAERVSFPTDFKLMQFNLATMKQALTNVPKRTSLSKSSVVISIPNASGNLERFELYEVSNFDATLQAQFPEIRAYVGVGLDDKYATLRMSLDPRGIQTMVMRADKATEFMEPYSVDGSIYAVYSSSTRRNGKLPFTCTTTDQNIVDELGKTYDVANRSSTGSLKVFRLALSCNGEYANYFGATSAAQSGLVLAAFNATMTRVNGVFEKDFAIHMNIVAETTNVIYYNPSTDPYSGMGNWNQELQNTLSSSLTGPSTSLAANNAAYDVGHMFGGSGGGGNAGCIGCVCDNDTSSLSDQNKGSGYTSPGDGIPMGDNFDIDYVAHELGHQFGANHTFSHGNEGSGVNKEVGSGVTVMGYAGITDFDTHIHSIAVFHSASIAQVQANMAGKTCPTNIAITHGAPVVNAGADYTIPKSTPFVLTGSATDAGGAGNLTYTWEQNNDGGGTGANSAASPTKTAGPNWTNYIDSSSPVRYFPKMSSILNGSKTTQGLDVTSEALSSVARTLDFRLTARDNVAGQGQTNFDDMKVTIDATRGPLEVTSQNTDGVSWIQGQTQTITWNVNGTNTSAGGANVDILLSTDNGLTFSTVLVANTPNDGSETITVPAVLSPNCRIMVKASNSIFFNVNVKNIAIGYVVTVTTTCTDYTRTFSPPQPMATAWTGYTFPTVTDDSIISDVNLKVVSTAQKTNQLSFGLAKPGSTVVDVTVFDQNCGFGKVNLNAVFDDEGVPFNCNATATGASYIPTSALSSLDGGSTLGVWRLAAKTVAPTAGFTNTISSATLTICSSVTTVVLASENFGINDLVLYPNPNNGTFNVQFTSDSGNEIKVNVHDMRGREIFAKSYVNNGLFNESLQLNKAQAGIYLVTIQDGAKKEVKKIVVE